MKNILILFSLFLISSSSFSQGENENLLLKMNGLWSGTLPCADCESIFYRINLRRNMTYLDQIIYNGKNVPNVISDGTWIFLNDSTLQLTSSSGITSAFRIRGTEIAMVDDKGNDMKGPNPAMFHLTKSTMQEKTETVDTKSFDDKRTKGIDFVGYGSEPSWDVEVNAGKSIFFKSIFEQIEMTTGSPREVPIMDVQGMSYIAQTESSVITVSVFHQECTDIMSGEKSPYSVTVDISSKNATPTKIFSGCGKYLGDNKLNRKWTLSKLNGKQVTADKFKTGKPYMEFRTDNSEVSGNAGCNSFNGSAEVIDDKVRFGNDFVMTRMTCDNISYENSFINTMKGKVLTYQIKNGRLKIRNGKKVVMEFN